MPGQYVAYSFHKMTPEWRRLPVEEREAGKDAFSEVVEDWASRLDHLHVHLVPRWTGDTNFMSVVGNVRVLPEEVGQSAERLRPVFERLGRDA